MDINLEDGRAIHFPRVSKGTGYADAVYRHDASSSEFYRSQEAWNGDGWTLKLQDGRQFVFPESSHWKTYAWGALIEMRDTAGNRIQLKRDRFRYLAELISPSGHAITFKYDTDGRIIEATDNTSDGATHIRRYSYAFGHLQTVSDDRNVLYRFDYEYHQGNDPYVMTSVKDGSGRELLRNWHDRGQRVSRQKLADGRVFQYDYLLDKKRDVTATTVILSGGKIETFYFTDGVPLRMK